MVGNTGENLMNNVTATPPFATSTIPVKLGDMPTNLSALNLSGTMHHDECSTEMTEINLAAIRFRFCEDRVYDPNATDEQVPHYRMAGGLYIPIDVRLALKFHNDQFLIPKSWEKAFADKRMCLHFTGTKLRSHGEADRYIYMFRGDTGWVFRTAIATNTVQRMELLLKIDTYQPRSKC